jgi:ArsR family transcriptional regulator, arsenate/arsenite/antimonite-responsive transcriptional repressor
MDELLNITAALADENRLRALLALRKGELCACQVIELLQLAPSTVSKHLAILKQAGLVESRKQGRWMHFRLAGSEAPAAVKEAITWVLAHSRSDPLAKSDRQRLCCILEQDPQDLCKAQRSKCCSSAPATPAAARWPKDGQRR